MYLSAQFLQVGRAFDAVKDFNPQIVKLVNPPLHTPHLGLTKYVGRFEQVNGHRIDESPLIDAKERGAEIWWDLYGPLVDQRAYLSAVECLNEPGTHPRNRPQAVARYCLRWLQLLDRRYNGKVQGVVCNFSEGTPEPETAISYLGLANYMAEKGHYFGFHSYWFPRHGIRDQELWHYQRWLYFYKELAKHTSAKPPVMITELGVDGGVAGKPRKGWRDADISWGEYLEDLISFKKEAQRFPLIKCGFVFCADTNSDDWRGFNLDYPNVKWLLESNAPNPPPPKPPERLELITQTRRHLHDACIHLDTRAYGDAKQSITNALGLVEDLGA